MATIFLVKDGPRGNTTSDGFTKPIQEITDLIGKRVCNFLGTEPPTFNITSPSSVYQHVVVEVIATDSTNQKFPKSGFYIVNDLDASQAGFLHQNIEKN